MRHTQPCKHALRCLCLLTSSLMPLRAGADLPSSDGWYHATWNHITLLSNASTSKTETIANSIADFVDSISHALPFPARADRWPLRIVLCRDSQTFASLAPDASKYGELVSGLFTEGLGYDVILLRADASRSDLRATLFHELVHREMRTNGDIPLWLDEGLAEVFSLFRIRKHTLEYGLSDAAHRHWIQRNGAMPLKRLFQVHHGSPEYNETPLTRSYYATCWAFTHYGLFANDGAMRESFLNLVEIARRGPITVEQFEQCFAMPMSEMEEQLRRYSRSFRFPHGQVPVPTRNSLDMHTWDHDAQHIHTCLLTGALTLSRRFEDARRMLSTLAIPQPTDAESTGLHNAYQVEHATLAFFEQDFESAHTHAQRAFQSGNRTPTTLLLHAEGLLQIQRGQRVRYDLVIPLPTLNLAFRNINQVLEVAPRNALACRLYVLAWLRTNQEPSVAQFRRLMDQARALPDDSEIAFLTADLFQFHQKYHLARQVLQTFRDHTTLKWAQEEAEQRLNQLP